MSFFSSFEKRITPETPAEKTENKDTIKNTIKAAIFGLVAFYGGIVGGPGGAENDKNKEAINLLNEINSQKIVAKANHEELTRFALDTFNSIAGGQEASAAETQAPLEQVTMDSKQLEENFQRSRAAWELWWKNQPDFKASQIKEFEAWANYARLQPGDKVRILWRPNDRGSLNIKSFAIAGESAKGSMLLADFFKAMAKELGDSYNPDNILNLEIIDRYGRKPPGSLGFNPESPANPLLPDYLKKHLPKGNLEKPDDTPAINLADINPRSALGDTPVQPFIYVWGPAGGWQMAEQSPNTTIADLILTPSAVPPTPIFKPFNPLPSRNTAGIRPAPGGTKSQITPGGPPSITTINIGEKIKPIEKIKETEITKKPTTEQPPLSQEPSVKTFGEQLAEKLTINADDIDAVSGASWDKLTEKMPSLTINEGLFLSAEDQKNPQVVEHFKNLIINKGEQKLKEIEIDLVKNFEFPVKAINDPKAIYNFAEKKLKDAPKENKVAFFLLVNSHKRILALRAEYTTEKK